MKGGAKSPTSGLLEEVFGFFEKGVAEGVFFGAAEFGKFLELGFLGRRQMCGHFNRHAHVQVAMTMALEVLDTFSFEPKHRARLRAGRDFDGGAAIEGGNFDVGPNGGLDKTDRHLAQQVLAVALKDLVRADMQDDVQVA